MQIITTTPALSALCERLSAAEYVTVDTEFLRESTYWPILCLVQVAAPEGEPDEDRARSSTRWRKASTSRPSGT